MTNLPRLYDYWRSSAAYRVRIALNVKGIEYEAIAVSLAPGYAEHRSEAYRTLNPQMLVPFFDDGNVSIGQSIAILEYLEEVYPDVPLLPTDRQARAKVRSLCLSICCDIHPLNNLRVLQYLRKFMASDEEQIAAWYTHWIHEGLRAAEEHASDHSSNEQFVFGQTATFADVALIPQIYNARRFGVPLDAFPTLVRIADRCNELPEFQSAAPEVQADSTL